MPDGGKPRAARAAHGGSTRPVSGDRRIEVWIVGEEPLAIDAPSLLPTRGGYLAARVRPTTEEALAGLSAGEDELGEEEAEEESGDEASVRVVSVVGLAHANGVLERCAQRALRDAHALERAYTTDEPEWVGY